MLGALDMRREAVPNVQDREFAGDIREHVNATLPFRVYRYPGQRRALAVHDFDARQIHTVFGESLLNDAAVFVVADQPSHPVLVPSRATWVSMFAVTPPA